MVISTFPDGFKGMLKGVIRALGIQHKAVYVSLCGHYLLNMTLIYVLTFKLGYGIYGMWMSKCVLEVFIASSYSLIIYMHDW